MNDTDSNAALVHIRLLSEASPARRVALMRALTRQAFWTSRNALRRGHPDWSDERLLIEHAALCYGRDLADRVARFIATRANRE